MEMFRNVASVSRRRYLHAESTLPNHFVLPVFFPLLFLLIIFLLLPHLPFGAHTPNVLCCWADWHPALYLSTGALSPRPSFHFWYPSFVINGGGYTVLRYSLSPHHHRRPSTILFFAIHKCIWRPTAARQEKEEVEDERPKSCCAPADRERKGIWHSIRAV